MKGFIGSQYLLKVALKKGIQAAIERLDSSETADKLESEIYRAYKGGIFDARTVKEMLDNIAVVRNKMGW